MRALSLLILTLVSGAVCAAPLSTYQSRWAQIKYQLKPKKQEKAFKSLHDAINSDLSNHAGQADYLIWAGIISASYAGARGGLGALKYVKEARHDLQQALKIDDKALAGSAYTSLGSLYYQVPGWPISFGDDDKAKALLKKALQLNPEGIDSNFFYADFLLDQHQYKEAERYFQKALVAAPRPGRQLADAGRRDEIQDKLKILAKKLHRK